MTDGTSFHGAPTARGRHDGPFILVVVLVVAGIALAIAKPWGAAGPPLASTAPRVAASGQPAASVTSPPVAVATHLAHPLPVAFTAPAPAGSSGWAGLDWSSLASDDPLGAVRAEVTLGATSVAIGDIPGSTSTTVWSSADGSHWQPIEDNTPTTFWPNISIVALATLPGRFVAVSEMNDYLLQNLPPVIAWSSTDGQSWTPAETLPLDPSSSPARSQSLVASGPHGLVVASSGPAARLATSSDGANWVVAPPNAFPADFELADLKGNPGGYVAVGTWTKGTGPDRAAALWSADGRHWPASPTLLPALAPGLGSPGVSNVFGLTVGDEGMIALGIGGPKGSTLWWQSADGRHWRALPTLPLTGLPTCGNPAGCDPQPIATLFGDGHRMVALRTGTDGAAWVSLDGQQWQPLAFSGDLPSGQATHATLLPGGVLVSDGVTTWFGQAEGG
jgi:hypothetical protein